MGRGKVGRGESPPFIPAFFDLSFARQPTPDKWAEQRLERRAKPPSMPTCRGGG